MSYDLTLVDPETREELHAKRVTGVNGGTYVMGGTTKLWLNVTYNYGPIYRQFFGESGIKSLHGVSAEASSKRLSSIIDLMKGEPDDDYWKATEGNARHALIGLLSLALQAPSHAVWEVS